MVIKNVALETVCGITSKLPANDKIEVAFAGKSNVGKQIYLPWSSLFAIYFPERNLSFSRKN